jgi:hypothetical protein
MRARRVLAGVLLVLGCGDNSSPGDWQRVEATALDGINFEAVWGVADDVWAVGQLYDFPMAAVVHFDGTTWDALPFVEGYWLSLPIRSLWATSPDDVWLAAGTLAHWNGHSWRTTNPLGDEVQFSHVWGSSLDDMWAVVTMGPEGSEAEVARSRGGDWTIVPGIPLDYGSGYGPTSGCSNATDDAWIAGFVVGNTEDPTLRGSVAHWNGTSWASHSIRGYDTSVVQLFCTGQSAVAVTGGGETLLLRWDGQDWQEIRADEPSFFDALWTTDSGDGWVGGAQVAAGDETLVSQIWRSDAGVLIPTVDPEMGLSGYRDNLSRIGGNVRAIWQTSSGRAFAFGPGGLVHQYVGPR